MINNLNEKFPLMASPEFWDEINYLKRKQQDETLSEQEHARLIEMFDELESMQAQRLEDLFAMAEKVNQPITEWLRTQDMLA